MWSKLRVKSQFYFFSMNLHSDMWKATEWLRCLPVFKIGIKISSCTFSLFFFFLKFVKSNWCLHNSEKTNKN